jgi:hypothetical protein
MRTAPPDAIIKGCPMTPGHRAPPEEEEVGATVHEAPEYASRLTQFSAATVK